MKDYLSRFVGKKVAISRLGVAKEVLFEGMLKEIVGEIAVLITEDGVELGIPLDKILMIGQPDKEKSGNVAGFIPPQAGFIGD